MERGRGIIMALFLIINILMMISCGNGGPEPKELKEGQAATADGTIIDLANVSQKIEDAVSFADGVKEVATLVKSIIDELPKVIGKKIDASGALISDTGDKNGPLLAGIFKLIFSVETKLAVLERTSGISNEIKGKVSDAKSKVEAFLGKLKTNHSDLGTDTHAPKALNVKGGDGSKGGTELKAPNASVVELLTAAQTFLSNAYKSFETPAKSNIAKT